MAAPLGVRSPAKLQEYIEGSEASRVYFDALSRICEELENRGEVITGPLAE